MVSHVELVSVKGDDYVLPKQSLCLMKMSKMCLVSTYEGTVEISERTFNRLRKEVMKEDMRKKYESDT